MISQWLEEREASPFTDEEAVILTFICSPKVTQIHLFPEPSCHPHLQGCKEVGFCADLRMLAKNKQQKKTVLVNNLPLCPHYFIHSAIIKYRFPSTIRKQSVPLKPFLSCNGINWRSNYLRTHLAHRCTEEMEIKHRCCQTQFKAPAAWCWDTECGSHGRHLVAPLAAWGSPHHCHGSL